jgi:alkylhydroperoxidase domain protein
MTTSTTHIDIVSQLAGIDAGSALAELRSQRPEAALHAQGSYSALFDPLENGGLSQLERLATALHVAKLHSATAAVAHFEARLGSADASGSPRVQAMLKHADLLSLSPAQAGPDDLQALADAGLSTREIVTLSQVIAFVSFFVRVLKGLELLGAQPPAQASVSDVVANEPAQAGTAAKVIRPPANLKRPTVFTVEQLSWTPWLQPLDLADASPKQAAALEGSRGQSPYFRLLALDVDVLTERTATDRGIFYTPGGAPRAERELSAAATSRLNGCIYCTSVHARLAAQLSKRDADIDRLLREGVAPGTPLGFDDRWQAVVDLAVAMAPTPPVASVQHVDRLRELGLQELEILDIIQAGAFFAWANRLMLTLGEPYFEQ